MLRKPEVINRQFKMGPPYDVTPEQFTKWQSNRQSNIASLIHLADFFAIAYLLSIVLTIILLVNPVSRKQGWVCLVAVGIVPAVGWLLVLGGMYR
jgi:hypothetical protein